MIKRFILMFGIAIAFLVLSGYAYAQYDDPDDLYGGPTICSYDYYGNPVYCDDQGGYDYNYYGHGPYWDRGEEQPWSEHHEWGEHREHERERGGHHEGREHHERH